MKVISWLYNSYYFYEKYKPNYKFEFMTRAQAEQVFNSKLAPNYKDFEFLVKYRTE